MSFGTRARPLRRGLALTTAAGESTMGEFFVEAGTQGIIIDIYHTSAGVGTMTYKIQAVHYTGGVSGWTQTYTDMLTSAAVAKDVGVRLVVDPRVTAIANTHAQTVLPYKVRVRGTAGAADSTGVFVTVSEVS